MLTYPIAPQRKATLPEQALAPGRLALLAILVAVAAAAVVLLGCGQPKRQRAIVTGKVLYNGKPLPFGTVIFEPESGQYATGTIQPDGTFRMITRGEGDGAPVGRCRVRFVCFAHQDPSAKTGKIKGNALPTETLPMGPSLIPQKYLFCETSGLVVDVKPGQNEPILFELTDN